MEFCAADLFHWKSEVAVRTTSGSITIHLRTLSSVQDEQRFDGATAASRVMRAELEDENSIGYQTHIAPIVKLKRDGLLGTIRALQRGLFVREARWTVEPYGDPDPPEDHPTILDMLDWRDEKDGLNEELEERRTAWVEEQMDVYDEELNQKADDELRELAIGLHSLSLCERAFTKEFDYETVFHGSYSDEACTTAFFTSVGEVRELPPHVFAPIAWAYRQLDEFSFDLDKLKNSS